MEIAFVGITYKTTTEINIMHVLFTQSPPWIMSHSHELANYLRF